MDLMLTRRSLLAETDPSLGLPETMTFFSACFFALLVCSEIVGIDTSANILYWRDYPFFYGSLRDEFDCEDVIWFLRLLFYLSAFPLLPFRFLYESLTRYSILNCWLISPNIVGFPPLSIVCDYTILDEAASFLSRALSLPDFSLMSFFWSYTAL